MSTHKSTKTRRDGREPLPADPKSLSGYADLLKLRSLAVSTQIEYLRYMRRLACHCGRDPAVLGEAEVRAYILRLKTESGYAPSSMRTAVAALSTFYNLHQGNAWTLFSLVRSPDHKTLPEVLTRAQLSALFAAVREARFRMILRLIYACGLRVSEAVALRVGDIEAEGTRLRIRQAKGQKDRLVPLPVWALTELRAFWKTHRHPVFLFPGVGRGWRDKPEEAHRLAAAAEPMGVSSIQNCLRHARAEARLPQAVCVHTLRHSYATHLLEEGVSIRLISAYLGHASLETTLVYTHLTAVNEQGAREALDRLRPL